MFLKSLAKQRQKYLAAILVVGFVVVSTFSALSPVVSAWDPAAPGAPGASTTNFDKLTAVQQAVVWSELSGALSGQCMFAGGTSAADIAAGSWFSKASNVKVGHHVEPNDGVVGCNNESGWFKNLLDAAGFAGDSTTPAKQVFTMNGSDFTANAGTQGKLKTLLTTGLFGTASAPTATDLKYVEYQILLTNFTAANGCNAKPFTTADDAVGKDTVDIYLYSGGAVTTAKYTYSASPTAAISLGYGLDVSGSGDGVLECKNIAAELHNSNQYANAMLEYATFSGDKTGDATNTANNSGFDSCKIPADSDGRWLTCMLLGWGEKTANALDSAIQTFLFTPTEQIFTDQLKTAWNSFRIIGVVLMLIAGLTMVISQALGLEIFDAYTVKKILPRLLIAAIGISLSWPIMQFVVTFFNDLGVWSHDIILSPFGSLANTATGTTYLAGLLGLGTAVVGAVILGVMGIISLIGTIVLALLIGLIVLSLRQIIILLAVLMAPLAIAAYILPGTQKLWEFWKNTFLTSLFMFPIIMAFIAAGKAMAAVAASTNSGQMHLLSAIVYFAPYFLLPFAFKLAGGLMATVFSVANDKNRGAFDRLKKGRQNRAAGNIAAMKAGKRWQGNRLADRASHGLQTASLIGQAGFNPLRMRGRVQSARSTRTSALSAEGAEKSTAVRSVLGNDDLLQASVHGNGTEADARSFLRNLGQEGQFLEQNVGSIRQAKRDMGKAAFEDFAAANIAGTGTGYRGGASEMFQTINRVAGGDRARAARILNSARGQAERAKRVDLYGAGFGTSADMLQQMYENNTAATADHVNEVMSDESLNSKSAGEIGTSRNNGFVNMTGAVVRRLARADAVVATARAGGNAAEIQVAEHEQKRVLAHTASLLDVAGSASPENAQIIGAVLGQGTTVDNIVTRQRLDMDGNPAVDSTTNLPVLESVVSGTRAGTVGERFEQLRGDAEFGQYRREYGSARSEAAAGGRYTPPTLEG